MVKTKALKIRPFQIWPAKSPDFKCFQVSNGWISDSHCIKAKFKDPFYLFCPLFKFSCPLFKLPDITISAASDDVIAVHGVLDQGVPVRVGEPHFAQTHFKARIASRITLSLLIWKYKKPFGLKNELKWGRNCQLKNLFLFTSFLNESHKL